jgi:hypothetical protein
MKVHYLRSQTLSPEAAELVQFDMDSIRRIVSGAHAAQPEIWVVDPDQYESKGRVLRDSASYRLVAYSPQTRTLYASDGCNACARTVTSLQNVPDIPQELIERLSSLTG